MELLLICFHFRSYSRIFFRILQKNVSWFVEAAFNVPRRTFWGFYWKQFVFLSSYGQWEEFFFEFWQKKFRRNSVSCILLFQSAILRIRKLLQGLTLFSYCYMGRNIQKPFQHGSENCSPPVQRSLKKQKSWKK